MKFMGKLLFKEIQLELKIYNQPKSLLEFQPTLPCPLLFHQIAAVVDTGGGPLDLIPFLLWLSPFSVLHVAGGDDLPLDLPKSDLASLD